MSLEVSCPSCSGHFRVPDTAAGKKIRCPKCQGAMDVPAASSPLSPGGRQDRGEEAAPPPARTAPPKPPKPKPAFALPKPELWYLKTELGEDYGPVPREELDSWHGEGRITAECQLLREGSDQWQWAGDVYADLNEADDPAQAETKAAATVKSPEESSTRQRDKKVAAPTGDGPPSTRSRLVAGLLGIFLGPLGTHRFYLGYWVLGLAMLATAGGCGIWSLIDAILIFLGKVPDADGRRLA
jgi:predicted Zn finger-like uncharacterized protein